ncbi:MAG: hypothetical protein AB8F95_05140 [Bacteroidia bacterium]
MYFIKKTTGEDFRTLGFFLIPVPFLIYLLYIIPREASLAVLGIFSCLFIWHGLIYTKLPKIPLKWIILAGLAYRILAVPPTPSLSDDYFRFLWDGQLLIHGENPFSRLPEDIKPTEYAALGLQQGLYTGLNSPSYFTIYPPVNQGFFALAAAIGGDNIPRGLWVLKLAILLAEILSFWFLYKLLCAWKKPTWWLGLYALNPLVIVELTGNIHFESWMICGILGSLYFLQKHKIIISAVFCGIAIASKLLPIMFFPLLIPVLGWRKSIIYGAVASLVGFVGFLALPHPEAVFNILESVGLYFENFEFNSSIYQWLKWAGIPHKLLGKTLPLLVILSILYMTWRSKDKGLNILARNMLIALSLYFICARIVHPWYITTLVALTSLTQLRYPLIWTSLLPITYLTYETTLYQQPYALMSLAYIVLAIYTFFEIKQLPDNQALSSKYHSP